MKISSFISVLIAALLGSGSIAAASATFESLVAAWPKEKQPFDRGFRIDDFFAGRLTNKSILKDVVTAESIKETVAFIDAQEEQRLKDVMEQLRDVPNKGELLASMRAPQKAFHGQVEAFLGYFAIPSVTIRRFDDLEFGVSGWAVLYENRIVRAFQLKSESMPEPEKKQAKPGARANTRDWGRSGFPMSLAACGSALPWALSL